MGVSLPRTAWMCNAADLLAKLAVAGNPEIIRAGSPLRGRDRHCSRLTGNTDVIHVAGTWNFLQIWFLGLTQNQRIRGPVDVAVEK